MVGEMKEIYGTLYFLHNFLKTNIGSKKQILGLPVYNSAYKNLGSIYLVLKISEKLSKVKNQNYSWNLRKGRIQSEPLHIILSRQVNTGKMWLT